MRNWWLIGALFFPLMSCGLLGDDEESSKDEDEEETDEEGEKSGKKGKGGSGSSSFGSLRGDGGSGSRQSASDDPIAQLFPSTVHMVFAVQDLEQLATDYQDFLDPSRAGDHEVGDALREMRREIKDTVGFDISDTDDWEGSGFDFERPWGSGILGSDLNANPGFVFAIPVADQDTAQGTLESWGAEGEVSFDCVDEGKAKICTPDTDEVIIAFTQDYMVFAGSDGGASAQSLLDQILDTKLDRLGDLEDFKRVYDRLQGGWNAVVWLSGEMFDKSMRDEMSRSEYEDIVELNEKFGSGPGTGFWGMGLSLSLSMEHIEADVVWGANWLSQFGDIIGSEGKDSLVSKLGGEAFAGLRISQNMEGLLEMIKQEEEAAEGWEVMRDELKTSMDIDIEDDILLNLNGNMTLLGLSDGEPGGLFYLGIKNEEKGKKLVSTLVELAKDGMQLPIAESESGGNTWYSFSQEGMDFGLAVAENNVILAAGKGRPQKVQDSLAEGKGGLLDNLGSRSANALKKGAPYVAVLNVPAMMQMVLDNPDIQSEMDLGREELRQLRRASELTKTCAGDVMISAGFDGGAMLVMARVESGTGEFGPCLELALEQGN